MEGEVVRDSVLFLAGRLDPRIGGPDQPVADAETGTRRTIYYRYASGDNIPFLTHVRRRECDGVLPPPRDDRAAAGAGHDQQRDGVDPRRRDRGGDRPRGRRATRRARGAFVDSAFERILGRAPTEAERAECAAGLVRLARRSRPRGQDRRPPEARARSALVHVLLNHNDFVTIR